MSGGSFDYAYQKVEQFAFDLAYKLDNPNEYDNSPPEVIAVLRKIERDVIKTAALMKEVEWLYSSDTGDDTFMERIKEIESSNVK